MNKNNTIDIGCATDSNFVHYTCVMLFSLFKNNPNYLFNIHLIANKSQNKYLESISKLVKYYNHNLNVHELNDNELHKFKVSGHATLANYYRLFYRQFVGESVAKILYLDSDMLILSDISELWHTQMLKNEIICAVDTEGFDSKLHFGIDLPNGYFNSGVLLIDINKWTNFNVTEKAVDFMNQNPDKIKLWDQDALNAVLANNWKKVDENWNMLIANYVNTTKLLPTEVKILHYAGEHKPASIHYQGPFKIIFKQYELEYFLKLDWFELLKQNKLVKLFNRFFHN